jgi:putative polymerase
MSGTAMVEIALGNRRVWIGSGLVVAAATFNMGLCFLNTHGLAISMTHVIAAEITITGLAAGMGYRIITPPVLTFGVALLTYFCMLWLVNGVVNPKVIRDVLIPLVFVSCGAACANPRHADRLVYSLIAIVFAVAVVEWFWFDQFRQVFDIFNYYYAKGSLDDSVLWMQGNMAVNGTRLEDEGRELFSGLGVLGLHRASSIFLEPTSIGTFSSVAFAWLLVRFRAAPSRNLIFMALVAALVVLGDSRFAAVACLILVIARLMPLLPETLVWLLPFVLVAGLIGFSTMFPFGFDQSFRGRLFWSGNLIASLDVREWFGIARGAAHSFLNNFSDSGDILTDSGYAYAIYSVGLPGLVGLWTALCFARDYTVDGARYRRLLAVYLSLALCIGGPVFSIKVGALAWFLLGASRNRDSVVPAANSVLRAQVSPAR